MGCCGKARNLNPGGKAPVTPVGRARAAVAAAPPAGVAFKLRDAFAMPIPGGWPVRVTDSKVVKAGSLKDAQSKLRLAGKAHSPEATQNNICQELFAMGRYDACLPAGPQADNRFFEEDQAYDADPRGPQGLQEQTYGAGPRAWARLHRRALDGKLSADYIRYFGSVISCHKCQAEFYRLIKETPPDYSNGGTQFAWTHLLHSLVNRRLDKAAVTFEEAQAIWV